MSHMTAHNKKTNERDIHVHAKTNGNLALNAEIQETLVVVLSYTQG